MRNKIKFKKLSYLIFIFFFAFSSTYGSESFTFDVTEIEILEEGNKFLGRNGGKAVTENGVTIYAESFEYNKLNNILYANTKVKLEDKSNNTTIYADKITYLKNDEIIFTQNKSRLIKENIIIDAKSFKFNRKLNSFVAEGKVKINDRDNDFFAQSEKITYFINLL